MTGKDWYKSFMKRNPTLSVRKGEGISYVRAQRQNEKKNIYVYFPMLSQLATASGLLS
jgi:hypothetical protein